MCKNKYFFWAKIRIPRALLSGHHDQRLIILHQVLFVPVLRVQCLRPAEELFSFIVLRFFLPKYWMHAQLSLQTTASYKVIFYKIWFWRFHKFNLFCFTQDNLAIVIVFFITTYSLFFCRRSLSSLSHHYHLRKIVPPT